MNRKSKAHRLAFRVRVPATTANLGPGFDCLGLALNWWNTIHVEPNGNGLEVECHWVLFIPAKPLSTKRSRNVLPRQVPREDAIFNVGRAALWMAALHTRQWDWLDLATADRLHQPYRSRLVYGMDALFQAAPQAGARGVALSGAGPSVIAFADCRAEKIARTVQRAAARIGLEGRTHIVGTSARGAVVTQT